MVEKNGLNCTQYTNVFTIIVQKYVYKNVNFNSSWSENSTRNPESLLSEHQLPS